MKSVARVFGFLCILALLATACKKEKTNKVPKADAGAAQTITLPVDSITVTGVGTDEDGTVVGYSWSEVSGPNAAIIIHAGASSTKIKGLVEGTYVFQLMVTDELGLSGLDTMSVKVNPSLIQTVTFQPHQNPLESNFAGNSTQNATDPGAPEVDAAAWTNNSALVLIRGAFRFDLSSIPANATIQSAKLTLYSNPTPGNGDLVHSNAGPNNTMLIQRIANNWDRTATWQTQPATTTADQLLIPHTSQAFLDLVDLDVTNMVKSMMTSGNYGFMLRLQTETIYNSRIFCSSKYGDPTKHPKLVVTYK